MALAHRLVLHASLQRTRTFLGDPAAARSRHVLGGGARGDGANGLISDTLLVAGHVFGRGEGAFAVHLCGGKLLRRILACRRAEAVGAEGQVNQCTARQRCGEFMA